MSCLNSFLGTSARCTWQTTPMCQPANQDAALPVTQGAAAFQTSIRYCPFLFLSWSLTFIQCCYAIKLWKSSINEWLFFHLEESTCGRWHFAWVDCNLFGDDVIINSCISHRFKNLKLFCISTVETANDWKSCKCSGFDFSIQNLNE